LQVTIRNKF